MASALQGSRLASTLLFHQRYNSQRPAGFRTAPTLFLPLMLAYMRQYHRPQLAVFNETDGICSGSFLHQLELLHLCCCAPASPLSAMLPQPRAVVQVHVQNATLAGGVAIGSAANLMVSPGGALAVGMSAGLLGTCGYAYLMPRLEAAIGLRDTCGVHNLHGMPGVLGGLVAALVAVLAPDANAPIMKIAGRTQARRV